MQLKSLLAAAMLFFGAAGTAQTLSLKSDSTAAVSQKDILKINLTSLALKNVSLQYEYILKKKMSLALGVRVMPNTAIPFENLLIKAVGEDDEDTKSLIRISRIGNFAFTPEVRFYLGQGYGRGFYIAPYYRFVHFTSNTMIVNYSEPGGPKRSLTMNGDMSAHTGGIMFGAQWMLGKRVALDWWIIGAHYGTESGKFIGIPSQALSASEQADVRQTLNNIDIPLVDKNVDVTANSVTVNTTGGFGALRAGLLLGIRL